MDWSDINEQNLQKAANVLENAASQGKPILICSAEDYYNTLLEKEYHQSKEFNIGPIKFLLMEKAKR